MLLEIQFSCRLACCAFRRNQGLHYVFGLARGRQVRHRHARQIGALFAAEHPRQAGITGNHPSALHNRESDEIILEDALETRGERDRFLGHGQPSSG